MRYQPTEPRTDDPASVMQHANRFKDKRALIVLGGYSASNWAELYAELKPDVILGGNGVNFLIDGLDYWMCAENMNRAHNRASIDEADAGRVKMFHHEAGAKVKMISHHSWNLLKDNKNCVKIRRQGYELNEIEEYFNFRDYGLGFLAGWLLKNKEAGAGVHVGTVGAQLLHLAGILGCAEVHTIGYDLMFKEEDRHHAYAYPLYQTDKFRTDSFRTEYKGSKTQWAWVESAQWLKAIEYLFRRDGLKWYDHSDGLLKVEGLECAA